MKALVASKKKLAIEAVHPQKGHFEEILSSRLVSLNLLGPSVRPKPAYQESVTRDVKKKGLKWPLLVLVNHPSLWQTPEYKCVHKDMILPYDSSKVFSIVVGNNRFYSAEELGYDRVSAVVLPNLSWLYPAQQALGAYQEPLTDEDVRKFTKSP